MKHFGTVKSFDEVKGQGSIAPEKGGEDLRFERSALSWDPKTSPKTGQRLSYELGQKDGQNTAVQLEQLETI